MKKEERLHRLYQTIKFNRPIVKETDFIMPGGYEGYALKMKDEDGREEVVSFDFEDFECSIDGDDPCVMHCIQKNPKWESFKDMDKVTAYMLRHITDVEEWPIYTRLSVENENLLPVAVTDVKFEVSSQDGVITLRMPWEWDPLSIIRLKEKGQGMDRERCMDLLHSVVNHVTSTGNTAESLGELLLMGFTPGELISEFDFDEGDVNDAVEKFVNGEVARFVNGEVARFVNGEETEDFARAVEDIGETSGMER